ncbi:c-type cytochrome [uncultured Dechloromonas sp.]|uniref:c-type cytochrome n=1 Tax=uncultured Dechloromonas sp. TaxID=171719 RepID=UPI0025E0835E|nr:c-type cytochrome [uncultured Dechloromonas sp.]
MNQSLVLAIALSLSFGAQAADVRDRVVDRVSQPLKGREVYMQSCAMCHSPGTGGAPRPGVSEDWAERARKGPAELMISVLRGKGAMPPKGGNASLSRTEAYLALDYMLNGDK